MITKLLRKKALQIGGLILLIASVCLPDIIGAFTGRMEWFTPWGKILVGCQIVVLNVIFLFFGFFIISEIKETNREIRQLEKELNKAREEKEQDSE